MPRHVREVHLGTLTTYKNFCPAGFQTKLSSAGLVYKHFGRDIIAKLLESRKDHEQVPPFPPEPCQHEACCVCPPLEGLLKISTSPSASSTALQVEKVYLAVYKHFMEAIDAIDNGKSFLHSNCCAHPLHWKAFSCQCPLSMAKNACRAGINQWDVDTPPKYMSTTNLSSRVGALNPRWNEDQSSERTDEQFLKAVQLTGSDFLDSVDYISKVHTPSPPCNSSLH